MTSELMRKKVWCWVGDTPVDIYANGIEASRFDLLQDVEPKIRHWETEGVKLARADE